MKKNYDVIVCGGGMSGVVAAISAKRLGMSVLLLESSGILGGSTTQSLVSPWMTFHDGETQITKGIAEEIVFELTQRGYAIGHIKDPIGFASTITPVDIEGVKSFLFEMIDQSGIDLLLHAFVYETRIEFNRIKSISVMTKSGKLSFEGDVFIDATGDGDLAQQSGIEFSLGREIDQAAQPMTMIFHVGNVDISKLKSYARSNPQEFYLEAPFEDNYVGLSGYFSLVNKAKQLNHLKIPRDRVLLFQELSDYEVSVNMTRIANLSGVDAFELSRAEQEGRKQIDNAFEFLKNYIPGFEQSKIIRTPSKIGVRETRHIKGLYTLTKSDILNRQSFDDSIGLASFPMDIHAPKGESLDLFEYDKLYKSYELPMRMMIPIKMEGLIITGRAVSATHEANASLRVTASVMTLGEAAGVMAAIAVKDKCTMHQLDCRKVQTVLLNRGIPIRH